MPTPTPTPTPSSVSAEARPVLFTVLLVEADAPDARLTTEGLTHEAARGPIVLDATSVTEACAVIAACRVDCVVLDFGLADVWGPEALSAIVAAAPGVPVVVLSVAEMRQAVRRRAVSAPAGPGPRPHGSGGDLRGFGSR